MGSFMRLFESRGNVCRGVERACESASPACLYQSLLLVTVIVFLVVSASPSFAGMLYGTVTDAFSQAGISGAVISASTGGSTSSVSDGSYFMSLPEGWTSLTVTAPGYNTAMTEVYILQSDALQQDFALIALSGSYGLSVLKNGSGGITSSSGGIVCGSTCSDVYLSGTVLTLTAIPDPGYVFAGWTGCDSVNGYLCSMTMNDNRSVTANFGAGVPSQILFEDGFSGDLSRWTLLGNGSPVILSSLFGRSGVLDSLGTGTEMWEVSNDLVYCNDGCILESDVYLDFTDPSGCQAGAFIGIPGVPSPNGIPVYFGLYWGLTSQGTAPSCGTVAETSLWGGISADDGNFVTFSLNADQYANGWHTLKVKINADRSTQFFVDGNLTWSPASKIDPALLQGQNIVVGGFSDGIAGKPYHDWVRAVSPRVFFSDPNANPSPLFSLKDLAGADICTGTVAAALSPYWPPDNYYIVDAKIADVDNDGRDEVITIARHSPYYPGQVAVFDDNCNLKGRYWNPGHLYSLVLSDIDADGIPELIVGGTNNDLLPGLTVPVIFALDGTSVSGQAPPYYGNNVPPGSPRWYTQVNGDNGGIKKISFSGNKILGNTGVDGSGINYCLDYFGQSVACPGSVTGTLPGALDSAELQYMTAGNADWFSQSVITHDGVDAAQSGDIGDSQVSSIRTDISGAGIVSFWWKVSSEYHYDFLKFFVDGVEVASVSGEVDWTNTVYPVIGDAPHTLEWVYSKDGSVSLGSDAGWLDQVVWLLGGVSLVEALDLESSWQITAPDSDAVWFGQSTTSYDNQSSSGQSGVIGDGQRSAFEITVPDEGEISFRWKVSSEQGWDFLRFFVDGQLQNQISGEVDWQLQKVGVTGQGTHVLRWEYSKDEWCCIGGSDTGWVDQVVWTPKNNLVSITAPHSGSFVDILYEMRGTSVAGPTSVLLSVYNRDTGYYLKANAGWSKTPQMLTADITLNSTTQMYEWFYDTSNVFFANAKWYDIKVTAEYSGGYRSTSSSTFYFYDGQPTATNLSMSLSSHTLKNGGSLEVGGKLTRMPSLNILEGLPIKLVIKDPDGMIRTPEPAGYTYDPSGHFEFSAQKGTQVTGFDKQGVYKIRARFEGNAFLAPAESQEESIYVGEAVGYAILVQGKIPSGEGLNEHYKTLSNVYRNLISRGFTDENIMHLNYSLDPLQANPTDDFPSKETLRFAVESWALGKMNAVPAPLYLVLVGHGNPDTFYIDNERLKPDELDQWLMNLESGLSPEALLQNRIIVIGTCYSGSFIPVLSKGAGGNAAGRVVISGSAADEVSYRGAEDGQNPPVRSGDLFVEEFFKGLAAGDSFATAFAVASEKIEVMTIRGGQLPGVTKYQDRSVQHPLLDDNGDGIGSHGISDLAGDGVVAGKLHLGVNVSGTSDVVSYCANVQPPPYEFSEITPTLFLGATDKTAAVTLWGSAPLSQDVDSAWVEVRSLADSVPSQTSSFQVEPATSKSPLSLVGLKRWEAAYGADDHKFDAPGMYMVYYYTAHRDSAWAADAQISSLRHSIVYRRSANNQPPSVPVLTTPPKYVSKNGVMFEWTRSEDPEEDAFTYTLEIANTRSMPDPYTMASIVYRRENILQNTAFVGPEDVCLADGVYFWRVLAVDRFGEITSSAVGSFTIEETNALNGILVGIVRDESSPSVSIGGASITINQGTTVSTQSFSDGAYYIAVAPTSSLSLYVFADGYKSKTIDNINVSEGEQKILDIYLTKNIQLYSLVTSVNPLSTGAGSIFGGGAYAFGTRVELTAFPGSDSVFSGWSGDCSGYTGNTISVDLNGNKSCSALFVLKQYSLAVLKSGTGDGSVAGGGTYSHGTVAAVGAIPNTNSVFAGWYGDCHGAEQTSVYMDTLKNCTAVFNLMPPVTYVLSIVKFGTGSGDVYGSGTYEQNYVASINAVPRVGSYFGGWSGDCSGSGQQTTVFMNGNKTNCFASFYLNPVLIITALPGTGSGTVTGAGVYNRNANATVIATADANSSVAAWGGACSGITKALGQLLMDSDKACTVSFVLDPSVIYPVKRGSSQYASLNDAITGVVANDVIQSMSGTFNFGAVVFDKASVIKMSGGYNRGFTSNYGAMTTIRGSVTVTGGSVIFENIVIR